MNVNKVILIGRLGQEPELKYTPSKVAVTTLSLATTETFKNKAGAQEERTEWHRISVFGRQAENCCKYLHKGRGIYVEGRLQTRSYEKDGQKHYVTEIVAQNVQFLFGAAPVDDALGKIQDDLAARKPQRRPEYQEQSFSVDDIPF